MKDYQIIEKGKYVMQTANEKWDTMDPIWRTLILCLGILLFLITKKLVLVGLVVILGFQRILYHIKCFKDKDDDPKIIPGEAESHCVKSTIKETERYFDEREKN
jgi:hypothetical protein